MQESGIYQNWLALFNTRKVKEINKEFMAYKSAKIEHFLGLFVICSSLMILALFVFIVEKFEMKNVKEQSVTKPVLIHQNQPRKRMSCRKQHHLKYGIFVQNYR